MSSTTRGFVGRHTAAERDPRLPPGQYDAHRDFPVLSAEVTPELAPADWSFRIDGLVDRPRAWDWEQARELPRETYDGPIHCVTSWSKLSTDFTGIALDTFLAEVAPRSSATHAVAYSHTGYTTNLTLADLTGGRAWIAFDFEGAPLTPAHGGPARLLVPHLYFWKSVKWIAGLRLLDHDEPGFWEVNGYHHRGDPWAEERYSGD
ncbi:MULTISPECIES: sulfite oxidase-like oxidoreductase [unclassified Embleya]|uniref:sulfite oxidase-like oxidoreductase n=1 Tax=unclassified Embleya TaxID=2699296 RepID=UPI0033D7A27D